MCKSNDCINLFKIISFKISTILLHKVTAQYLFSPTTRSGLYFVSLDPSCGYIINTKAPILGGFGVNGAASKNRTYDPTLTKGVLYH